MKPFRRIAGNMGLRGYKAILLAVMMAGDPKSIGSHATALRGPQLPPTHEPRYATGDSEPGGGHGKWWERAGVYAIG